MAIQPSNTPLPAPVEVGALFDAHAAMLLRLVQRLTGPGDHVEDIVQDTFLVAHRRSGALSTARNQRAWLSSVAVRLARHHVSKTRRRRGLRSRFEAEAHAAPPRGPEACAEASEQARLIYAALDRLPHKQREAVVLYELEGLEGAQIAALVGVPLGTVWTRLRSGREQLKALLVRRGLFSGGAA